MFTVLVLSRLDDAQSRDAIVKPFEGSEAPVFDESSIQLIITHSGGYPYFIQFICKEIYDIFLQQMGRGEKPLVPMDAIIRKLDNDFFAGRWARTTERERDLLLAIAMVGREEFGISDVSSAMASDKMLPSQISQMFKKLIEAGLIYKMRHGSYAFAVPLLGSFILRQQAE